ncbi:uroporphyrinogen III methyltransferase / synthase [Paenibacillus macquariensis]|uniref:uroporphyrinogen-III C-methyltransferase n=1 Tax=Paenibacillus macquariensis TaxID=948756 RepID=A0ABY1JTC3_9BACL|nr:uroporphyrinogen III methyltransferase / synthase [Paenibacillus macquariensis]
MSLVNGKVYLVGAGPGDAGLITVKGLECIKKADVVVYDRLANPRLLQSMRPGAQKVYVGKLPDRHTMKQEEINQLLVDLALEGKTVTRLKGGDPTVFGRVGEEAELLRENGIRYEIIPGITSAISVPAYAGIPVTHRDMASSFSIITGHESPDKLDRMIQWDKLANATGTLIFLMGVAKIGYISQQLITNGRQASTPVALVRWGTRAEQETLTGTLADIEDKVKAANFQAPAVIVVGDVVLQREKLMWAEYMPLFGKRILVTRARSQASELASRIEELGGESYEFPVIEIVKPSDPIEILNIEKSFSELESYDWIFFTSVNGVSFFFQHLQEQGLDIRSLHRAKIVAVGPATAEALKLRSIMPEQLPERFQAEGIVEMLGTRLEAGQKVLLPRGDKGRMWLPEKLTEMGLDVTNTVTYHTVITGEEDDELLRMFDESGIHAITFTSSSTVTNFLTIMKRMGIQDPIKHLEGVETFCIGEITAKTAMDAGLTVGRVAEEATIDSLVNSLCGWNA